MDVYIRRKALVPSLCDDVLLNAYNDTSTSSCELRSSEIRWLRNESVWEDLLYMLQESITQVGCEIFNELNLQLITPVELKSENALDCWNRRDLNKSYGRLGFTIYLNEPSTYKGGDLSFVSPKSKIETDQKEKGTLVIFRSSLFYNFSSVTQGCKHYILGWFL